MTATQASPPPGGVFHAAGTWEATAMVAGAALAAAATLPVAPDPAADPSLAAAVDRLAAELAAERVYSAALADLAVALLGETGRWPFGRKAARRRHILDTLGARVRQLGREDAR